MNMHSRQRAAAAFAVFAAVGAVVVAALASDSRPSPVDCSYPARSLAQLKRPLPFAQTMSLRAAAAAIGFAVPVPDTAIAGPQNLTTVWVRAKTGQLALVYGDGDVTVMMSRASYRDPRIEFSTFVRENKEAKVGLGSVDGHVALVISPNTERACPNPPNPPNPAWVEIDRDGIDVNVVSSAHRTAALLAVAQSLQTRA